MSELKGKKLLGRIIELYGTRKAFGEAIGETPARISRKLRDPMSLSVTDAAKWAKALEIAPEDFNVFFLPSLLQK